MLPELNVFKLPELEMNTTLLDGHRRVVDGPCEGNGWTQLVCDTKIVCYWNWNIIKLTGIRIRLETFAMSTELE